MRATPLLLTLLLLGPTSCEKNPRHSEKGMTAHFHLSQLRDASVHFREHHGRWPASLSELAKETESGELPLVDPWGRPYLMSHDTAGPPEFHTLGSDGQPGGAGHREDISTSSRERGS